MNEMLQKIFDEINKGMRIHMKMIVWIAERTLSVKDFKEFIDEFAKADSKTTKEGDIE